MNTINNENFRACFVNTENFPINQKHLGWNVVKSYSIDGIFYILQEIVEDFYPHPDAPEHSNISIIRFYERNRMKDFDRDAGPLIIMYHQQQTLKQLFPQRHF